MRVPGQKIKAGMQRVWKPGNAPASMVRCRLEKRGKKDAGKRLTGLWIADIVKVVNKKSDTIPDSCGILREDCLYGIRKIKSLSGCCILQAVKR